jgi:hypothetical protein
MSKTETADPVTALVQLRGEIARLAREVEALSDCACAASVRSMAPRLAHRMRAAVMAPVMVAASRQ